MFIYLKKYVIRSKKLTLILKSNFTLQYESKKGLREIYLD